MKPSCANAVNTMVCIPFKQAAKSGVHTGKQGEISTFLHVSIQWSCGKEKPDLMHATPPFNVMNSSMRTSALTLYKLSCYYNTIWLFSPFAATSANIIGIINIKMSHILTKVMLKRYKKHYKNEFTDHHLCTWTQSCLNASVSWVLFPLFCCEVNFT